MNKGYFGVMLDMSRNGVMKVEKVKEFAKILASFGYNMIQLYTEDTYEVDNEPYFGYMRGRYSKAELKEIVSYCESIGIEVIPCVQTLAHLNQIFTWPIYHQILDCADIMLVGEERTYVLLENIFKTLRECFTSKYINIGMDEAMTLGLGKYLQKNGYHDRFEILLKHLKIVCELAEKYGFKPTMWSDMFIRIANNNEYYPANPNPIPDEVKALVPENVGLIYWDYYHTNYEHYDKMLNIHEEFKRDVWFAGGAWCWGTFSPRNGFTLATMKPAMKACLDHSVNNVLITMWGDNGKECSFFSLLPSLYAVRKYYEGVTDEKVIKEGFEKLTGENYDKFFDLDLPNLVAEDYGGRNCLGKYGLYNDPFNGYLDSTVAEGVGKKYKKVACRLRKHEKTGDYAHIFDCIAKLCDVLTYKVELGSLTRKYYQANDKEALKELLHSYKMSERKLEAFYKSFKNCWFIDNKPCGFDVQDIRLGGLKQRLKSCRERLEDYLAGKIDSIPELEEKLLDYCGVGDMGKAINVPRWGETVTPNKL